MLFLLGVAACTGSLEEEEEIPDSASPPFDFLLHAFAAYNKVSTLRHGVDCLAMLESVHFTRVSRS